MRSHPERLLMLAIHPQARTTPAVRAEIARSPERSGVLAECYGFSAETVREWRKRGPVSCHDRSARSHKLEGSSYRIGKSTVVANLRAAHRARKNGA